MMCFILLLGKIYLLMTKLQNMICMEVIDIQKRTDCNDHCACLSILFWEWTVFEFVIK